MTWVINFARRIIPGGRTRNIAIAAIVLALALAGWAALEAALEPATPLSAWMPSGALLYIDSPDFAGLLHDWSASHEKQAWLKSDNYEVFSRSRLFGRLADAQHEFAGAAGQQPDMKFLSQIAGKQSALAIYDIGKIEFVYITHMPSAQTAQTGLMQSRSGFETRKVGNAVFYLRTTGGSKAGGDQGGNPRTVAFATSGDYLLLATRDDLLAGALALIEIQNQQPLSKDGWFIDAMRASSKPGDLRMVLDLSRLVPSPYFRSYWVQQNITEMGHYRAAISDLYLTHGEFQEERALLPKSPESANLEQADLTELGSLVPSDAGFFRAESAPRIDSVLEAIDTRLLSRGIADYNDSTQTPPGAQSTTPPGSEDDLDARIDAPQAVAPHKGAELAELRSLLEAQQPATMLVIEKSSPIPGGVFVGYHSAVVLESQKQWIAPEVELALSRVLESHLTAGNLGIQWKHANDGQNYYETDGAEPLAFAISGRYCIFADDTDMLNAVLQKTAAVKESSAQPLMLLSSFNHDAERLKFQRATKLMDSASAGSRANGDNDDETSGEAPQFFSRNVASLSNAFAAMQREEVREYWKDAVLHQAVKYDWK